MSTLKPNTLSACLIVKNEETLLARCLASIRGAADEIIVVDTGSTDNTIEIARSNGAKVVETRWQNDFSHARNISLENATGNWVLWLDADDVVPEESVKALNELKKEQPDKVFGLIVRNQKPGNIGSEFVQARMFPNGMGIKFERRIHEQMMPSALRLGLHLENRPIIIEHYGYGNPEELKKKAQRNVELLTHDYNKAQPDAVTAVEIADSYSIIEDFDNAARWYEHVCAIARCEEQTPAIASQAFLGLANICNKKDDYDAAIRHFGKAAQLCNDRVDALYGLAVAQDNSGRKQEAIDTLFRILSKKDKQAVQVSIDFRQVEIKAYLRLGTLLGAEAQFDKLNALVVQALKKHGQRPEIINMAALAFFQQNKLMDALRTYERSLQVAIDGNVDAYIGLCVIYYKVQKADVLEKTMVQMRNLFSYSPRFWAFYLLIGERGADVAPQVDREKIEKEIDYLSNLYNLEKRKA